MLNRKVLSTKKLEALEVRKSTLESELVQLKESIEFEKNPKPRHIGSVKDMMWLAAQLGVRRDWHEPDEQDVTAMVEGHLFDNAGCGPELNILISKENELVARINLASLCAMAAGTMTECGRSGISTTRKDVSDACVKLYDAIAELGEFPLLPAGTQIALNTLLRKYNDVAENERKMWS